MNLEQINELTKHFLIAKLESDLKIEKTKVVYRETQNGGHYECYDFETQRVIDEIERQLNELKNGK